MSPKKIELGNNRFIVTFTEWKYIDISRDIAKFCNAENAVVDTCGPVAVTSEYTTPGESRFTMFVIFKRIVKRDDKVRETF